MEKLDGVLQRYPAPGTSLVDKEPTEIKDLLRNFNSLENDEH